jgi:uncharacterized protein (TIGR00290 family)
MSTNINISWSGGKDSALALDRLLYHGAYRLTGLFTVYDKITQRVPIHHTPIELIRRQADSLGLPWHGIPLPANASNADYEAAHLELFRQLQKDSGLEAVAYGDIGLEDVRQYRDTLSAQAGLPFVYPLWQGGSSYLSQDFISRGFKAIITSIDPEKVPEDSLGSLYDEAFVASLPTETDIMGENGEFHTFVFDGPMFSSRVKWKAGEISESDFTTPSGRKMKLLDISPK